MKNTSKVTGFIGSTDNRPSPISKGEVDKIMTQIQEGIEKSCPKTLFRVGGVVHVKEGSFTDFDGNIEEVDYEKSCLCVSVTTFGHAAPIELEFDQAEKV